MIKRIKNFIAHKWLSITKNRVQQGCSIYKSAALQYTNIIKYMILQKTI